MKTPIPHPDSFQQTGKQPIILFALSLIFALSMLLPDKCLAQEKEAYAVLSENVLTFYYDQYRGIREGIKYDMNSSGASSAWHGTPEEPSPITTVIFNPSFDSYYPETCSDWFLWCTNLTEIKDIKYLHTDNAVSLSWMFDHCENLETIDVSHFKTTQVKRMDGMFSNCKKLTELDVSNFDTKQVENMECMFAGCENLTELIINFETPKVKSMNSMFAGCSKLTKLDMGSSFTAENVSDMFSMFSSCNELTSIDLSHFNTSNVTRMDNMFLDCTALTSIIFPTDFNTRKVERMDEMFSYCVSMISLDLRTFNTENVVDMRGMFESCEHLTTILVSDTWNIDNLSKNFENFENYNLNYYSPIFNRCENLIGNDGTKYTDPTSQQFNANPNYTQYHQDINYANANDGYLTKDSYKIFYDADGNGIIDDNDNNVSWENGEHPQTNILSSTTITQKPIIDGKVFLGWKVKPSTESDNNLQKTIEIPEGAVGNRIYTAVWGEPYVVIDNGTMTFYCKDSENKPENALRIQEIWNYPEWTDEVRKSVTKAVFDDSFKDYKPTNCGYWFYELINLTDISGMKENLNTSDVKDMGFMFYNCKSLSSIDLSSFQTGNVTNMNNMFSGCKNLTTIDVTSFNTENVKTMAGLFQSCSELTTIDVHNFNTANVLDMFDWCNYCDNLKVLDLRSFETNNNTDIRNMFCHDVSLTTIIVSPDKWKSVKTSSFENTDIIPENPFIDTPQLIGDKGTGYSENSGLSYAHIDGGASNPGYFTTDSYKIFYDLDGDGKIDNVNQYEWESEPPLNFSIVRNAPIDIPNLKSQNGKTFKGWKGTPITGLTEPTQNVTIKTEDIGNRIYTAVWGDKEAYVVASKDNTLTFYYDTDQTSKSTEENTTYIYSINELNESGLPAWINETDNPYQKVIFDDSFKEFRPTTCEKWFYHCSNITKFEQMYNLITDEVTNMNSMFAGCKSIVVLPLWSFNTSRVTDMRNMFSDCKKLTTILVLDSWSTQSVLNEYKNSPMFDNCTNIIGDTCTLYSAQHIDCEYARVDNIKNNQPGYLTYEMCKVFYEFDGGLMPALPEGYLISFAYGYNQDLIILNPTKDGYIFLGWTEKYASGISDTEPTKDVFITNGIYGNRIYTAHWIEDHNETIVYYPTNDQEREIYCDLLQNKTIIAKIKSSDVSKYDKYQLTINDFNINIDGYLSNTTINNNSEYEITINNIPAQLTSNKYIGNLDLYEPNSNEVSFHLKLIIQLLAHQNVILHLYEDVIFINNHDSIFKEYQWYKNGDPINGATRQYIYDKEMKGNTYMAKMVTIDNNEVHACPIYEEPLLSKKNNEPVKTYPNPAVANQEFSIEIMDFDPEVSYAIKISNSNGVIVKEIHDATQISTIALPRGVYSGALISGGRKKGFKLIVR